MGLVALQMSRFGWYGWFGCEPLETGCGWRACSDLAGEGDLATPSIATAAAAGSVGATFRTAAGLETGA